METTHLRCEYLENPIGIDETRPRLSWKLQSRKHSAKQTAYQIQCSREIDFTTKIWDTSKIQSSQSTHVHYEGQTLHSRDRVYWRVRVWDELDETSEWSYTAYWEMGLLNPSDWIAKWIDPEAEIDSEIIQPASFLRKEFEINESATTGRLYITAHGLYEVWINGKRVGEQYFTPGRTQYDKRLQYQTYDVTALLKQGMNSIGVILGDGWWRGKVSFGGRRNISGERISLLLQLELNSEVVAITDESWKCTSNGPIRKSDLQMGDVYDSRMEIPGWMDTEFQDEDWRPANVVDFPEETLIASMSVPVREKERFSPNIIHTPSGEKVLDFGQNIAGYVEMSIKEGVPVNITVRLTHGETLDENGNFTQRNMSNTKKEDFQCDLYIHDGNLRIFKPKFSVKGFRYVKVEIEGPSDVTMDSFDFTSIALYSDMERTGNFSCSNELVNRLVENSLWSQKGNFLDIPTDCPQRERSGWSGDAQVFAFTGSLLMNTASFLTKWMKDVALTQREDGRVANIIPIEKPIGVVEGSAGWGDAAVIIPWTLWKVFGDAKILENQYESMKAWVRYQQERAKSVHWIRKLNPLNWTSRKREMLRNMWDTNYHWGEWLEPWIKSKARQFAGIIKRILVSDPEVATAYLSYSNRLFAEIANYLGRTEDATKSDEFAEKAARAYQMRYLMKGRMKTNKQANIVRPLALGLVPPEDLESVSKQLNELVKKHDYHIGTGFLSTPFLCSMLSDYGYVDTAYRLLTQTTPPSWLYSVTKGATTIWESWYGIKENGEPFESLNHYSYGAVVGWLFTTVVGIKPDLENPGFKHFYLEPKPGGDLTHAEGSFDSPYGVIQSSWQKGLRKTEYKFIVPPNSTATAKLQGLPSSFEGTIGVSNIQHHEWGVSFDIESGSYSFTMESED